MSVSPRLSSVRDRIRRSREFRRRRRAGFQSYESEYLKWMSFAVAGMFHPGNAHLVDKAIQALPTDDPVLEIGAFAGLSTNVLTYFLRLHGRRSRLFTTDPWIFEGEEEAGLPESTISFEAYRAEVRRQFEENVKFWSVERLPHGFALTSDEFFAAWRSRATLVDVFGRDCRLGGPIAFCFIDGDHTYEQAKRDFVHADELLVSGGFVLFDDSDEFGAFPHIHRIVEEALRDGRYELVGANPHHLIRKRR